MLDPSDGRDTTGGASAGVNSGRKSMYEVFHVERLWNGTCQEGLFHPCFHGVMMAVDNLWIKLAQTYLGEAAPGLTLAADSSRVKKPCRSLGRACGSMQFLKDQLHRKDCVESFARAKSRRSVEIADRIRDLARTVTEGTGSGR